MDVQELRDDLAAFADEEDDVEIDADGTFVVLRGGQEITGKLIESSDGALLVDRERAQISYRRFLTHDLGRLDVFADRIVSRRARVSAYVDGQITLLRPADDPSTGAALEVLRAECDETPPFAARISFITADAGHGKTALLREFQARQARDFLDGKTQYLFWHVDLQGRQLLRLSEALMGDLGELRIAGLWMPALVRLIRMKALVIAIDGFDELAAEQGGTDALGALANLVSQLGGHGVVIAAARRTFFDTEDYLKRTGLITRALASPCQFDQLSLAPWGRSEGIQYLERLDLDGKRVADPQRTYDQIAAELGPSQDHPMITRPFLLAQVARALLMYDIEPAEFLRSAEDPLSGVAAVVQAFVSREVAQKWVYADTGAPYLTVEQHMHLLADIAEEMHRNQKDRLDVDVIETIAAILLEQWGIDQSRRQQVHEMVRMHVLLVIPPDSDSDVRSFDHPEFRDYFIAYALRAHVVRVMEGQEAGPLARYLSVAQVSDATARYVCGMLDRSEARVTALLAALEAALEREWKPTFLQVNLGTLIPFVLDGLRPEHAIRFGGKVIYSSLVLERSNLTNVVIANGSFVNVSLRGVSWAGVTLKDCILGDLTFDQDSQFETVVFDSCNLEAIRIVEDDDEVREYAPDRKSARLAELNIYLADDAGQLELELPVAEDSHGQKALRRVLRVFSRTTTISDTHLTYRFRHDQRLVIETIMPLLVTHNVVSTEQWRGAGAGVAWTIKTRIDDLLASEGASHPTPYDDFWAAVALL